jgi:uncharacterized protein
MQRVREILPPNEVNMIIYHAGCHDGFSAAWVGHTILKNNCEYIGVSHTVKEVPKEIDGKNILMVDFSFDATKCAEIAKRANRFIILDHHATAEQTLSQFEFAYFNMNKSGVTLSWEYFYPDTSVPKFIRCIETRDIWKFEERSKELLADGSINPDYCPEAKAFTYFWYNYAKFDIETDFQKYYEVLASNQLFQKYVEIGKHLVNYIEQEVNYTCKDAVDAYWTDTKTGTKHKVKVLNSGWSVSDVGNVLANNEDVSFAVMWTYNHVYDSYRISLRSNGSFNVAEMAKLYNGGGHRSASGFGMKEHPKTLFEVIKEDKK